MEPDEGRARPPEPEDGQDDAPPDLVLALIVATDLFDDIRFHLDPEYDDRDADDLRLRIDAVVKVLARARAWVEERR